MRRTCIFEFAFSLFTLFNPIRMGFIHKTYDTSAFITRSLYRSFFPSFLRFPTTAQNMLTTPITVILSFNKRTRLVFLLGTSCPRTNTHELLCMTEYIVPKEVRMRQENDKTSTQDLSCSTQNHCILM